MKKYKIKNVKPEYKTHSKKRTNEDKVFESLIKKHTYEFYTREILIDNLIEKEMYGNQRNKRTVKSFAQAYFKLKYLGVLAIFAKW